MKEGIIYNAPYTYLAEISETLYELSIFIPVMGYKQVIFPETYKKNGAIHSIECSIKQGTTAPASSGHARYLLEVTDPATESVEVLVLDEASNSIRQSVLLIEKNANKGLFNPKAKVNSVHSNVPFSIAQWEDSYYEPAVNGVLKNDIQVGVLVFKEDGLPNVQQIISRDHGAGNHLVLDGEEVKELPDGEKAGAEIEDGSILIKINGLDQIIKKNGTVTAKTRKRQSRFLEYV